MKSVETLRAEVKSVRDSIVVLRSVMDEPDHAEKRRREEHEREVRPLREKLERLRHSRDNAAALTQQYRESQRRVKTQLTRLANGGRIRKMIRLIKQINRIEGRKNADYGAVFAEIEESREKVSSYKHLLAWYDAEIDYLRRLADPTRFAKMESELQVKIDHSTRHLSRWLTARQHGPAMIEAAWDQLASLTELLRVALVDDRIAKLYATTKEIEALQKELEDAST
jgi:chromosome segregation ATPase